MKKIITEILNYAISNKASDTHISEWKQLSFRIHWELLNLENSWIIDRDKIYKILDELFYWDKNNIEKFLKNHDVDFAYLNEDTTSFRVNWFFKMWKISFVLRKIEKEAMPMEKLWLPIWVNQFIKLKQWLILITWPTWSWKSTSMVAILNQINENRWEHIITIEDPIEFVFTNKKSIFSQREVGNDTNSFQSALRAAMREDPDIVMVGEMRDRETVSAALELAETWHLVISTLHTSSAVQTIQRLLSFYPNDMQNNIMNKLADSLQGVLSQRLVQRADWAWRIWIYELLMVNTWIKNQIRTGTFNQIQSSIETWSKYWMITMKDYADRLAKSWLIKEEDYMNYFSDDNF